MKTLVEKINEALLNEASKPYIKSVEDIDDNFIHFLTKEAKGLKIQSAEKKRYDAKGGISKETAQDILSRRLYDHICYNYEIEPETFLEICKNSDVKVNMSNLGYGFDNVIKWGIPKKKINPKDIYFDDADLVWYDKTIGYRWDDGGIEMLPEYEDRAEEVLAILNKSKTYTDDFYLVKK